MHASDPFYDTPGKLQGEQSQKLIIYVPQALIDVIPSSYGLFAKQMQGKIWMEDEKWQVTRLALEINQFALEP